MKKLFWFLFLFLPNIVFAQNFFEGKLLKPSADAATVNIYNLTKGIGTTDDDTGYFKITSSVNDSLIITSIQYKEIIHIVSKMDFGKLIEFKLVPETNELAEITIKNTILTGILSLDVKEAKIDFYDNFGFEFPKNRPYINPIQKEINFISSDLISNVIYTLNGKLKRLKENSKIATIEILIDRCHKLIGTTYFTQILTIPETEISTFLYFCNQNERLKKLSTLGDKLKLMDFLSEKNEEFKNRD